MQKRYKKRSELTEKTNMGYPTLADELNIETVNDQLAKVPGFEHMLTYGSKKPRFIDGGGNETLRIESINESVSRITNGMQGLFEVRESKKKITEQKQKPYKMSKTYEIWDEEAINAGATDNSGFEYKKQTFDSLWELAKEIRDGGGSESSSSQSNPHNYYTTDADEDIRTGEKTFYSFHPEGLSKDDAVQLDAFLDMDERDFRKSEPRDESISLNAKKKLLEAKKSSKKLDAEINAAYKKHGDRVEVSMMDIPKIFRAGEEADAAGESIEDAVKAAIAKYRVN